MKRRTLLAAGAAALALPTTTRAQQQGRLYRIAVWHIAEPIANMMPDGIPRFRALFAELTRLGFIEGRNLAVQRYTGEGRPDRYPVIVREIVDSRPDLIVPNGTAPTQMLRGLTSDIPIVVPAVVDPVSSGLVASLARPGGNVTGFSQDGGTEMWGLRLQLLKDVVPAGRRFGFLTSQAALALTAPTLDDVAPRLGVTMTHLPMDGGFNESGYRRMFERARAERLDGIVVSTVGENVANRRIIVALAMEFAMPAIYGFSDFTDAGGLMSYGPDLVDNFRKAAGYVARILNGTKPADLPVQQPTKFNLAVHAKTAKALGLEIPFLVLARADEVIE